jgi:hypothetical protein
MRTAMLLLGIALIGCGAPAAPTAQSSALSPHGSSLRIHSANTLSLVEVVKRLPDYQPLDAAFQEPRDSKTTHRGGDKYRTTGRVRAKGQESHTFELDLTMNQQGHKVDRLVIDGKSRQ